MSTFIGIYRDEDRTSASSLQVKDDYLIVLGVIPHGSKVTPKSPAEARKLADWLNKWADAHK